MQTRCASGVFTLYSEESSGVTVAVEGTPREASLEERTEVNLGWGFYLNLYYIVFILYFISERLNKDIIWILRDI